MTENALDQFIAHLADCQKAMDRIQEAIDDHLDVAPDDVTWANVGDADRLRADLETVAEYIGASE